VVGAALAAIAGHNFPVFLGFRGGKGVATGLGVLIGIAPHIAGLVFFLWVLVVVVTRYISVASVIAGASVPLLMLLSSRLQDTYWGRPVPQEYLYLGIVGAGFIVIKHRSNFVRLMNGTEPRVGQRVAVERPGEAGQRRGGAK
jgi:glycerol-3-phosphate acyltransferase PlsY